MTRGTSNSEAKERAAACRATIFAQESGALFRDEERGLLLGCGPFHAAEEPPPGETVFYVNNYSLSDPKPWKIPSRLEILPLPAEQTPFLPVSWEAPRDEAFRAIFGEIMRSIRSGEIDKTVPALAEHGRLEAGDPREFVCLAAGASSSQYPYAFWERGRGFAGFSPEYLFRLHGRTLETMALAGTTPSACAERLRNDAKEITEHQIVVEAIAHRLAPFGLLKRGKRRVRALGPVSHLFTPIRLKAKEEHRPDFWIHLLHPTPALGPQPRTSATLAQLKAWRERLGCPPVFGAPFGIAHDGHANIAAVLRGISWEGNAVSLTAGGGIIAASTPEGEWGEFALKRASIKLLFGMSPREEASAAVLDPQR